MSALDQALIKAYAKDRPSATTSVKASTPSRPASLAASSASASAIEQIYRDGTLYRIETPIAAGSTIAAPSQPHISRLPPTSPRRGVRRSMLRLLTASAETNAVAVPSESLPRVARKVIFRHIPHSAPPPPLGRLLPPPSEKASPQTAVPNTPVAELPPETILDEPAPLPSILPPTTPSVPLNEIQDSTSRVEVRGFWEHTLAPQAMVVVSHEMDLRNESPSPRIAIDLGNVPEPKPIELSSSALISAPESESSESFTVKSLDDCDEPRLILGIDAPHSRHGHRPHVRFAPEPNEKSLDQATSVAPVESPLTTATQTAEDDLNWMDDSPQLGDSASSPIELSFAEPTSSEDHSLAAFAQPETPPQPPEASSVESAKPAAPVWEVDHFQWPKTCEKLFADKNGYLVRASGKLLAAVQDGLRVLAVTGNRRGEGRTTLALCLARAAAQAGLSTAIMDADFARPQLASKLGLEIAYGWQDAALGKIPLSEAAVKSLSDNITLLPLESAAVSRSLSLADPRVTATIRAAAATFELLILDLSPLNGGDDLQFPAGERCPFDAAIVVRDLRFATAAESEAVGHTLHDAGVEAVGVAENFVVEEELPATSV